MSSRMAVMLAAGALLAAGAARAERGSLGDPTRPTSLHEVAPSVRTAPAGPRWQLQSTLVAPGRKLAVINGRQLGLGQSVDGATLVDIRPDGVTLQFERRKMELRLVPETASIRKGAN